MPLWADCERKMVLFKVGEQNNYRLWAGVDENNGKTVYNATPLYHKKAPQSGYYDKSYIEKIKGVKFPEKLL